MILIQRLLRLLPAMALFLTLLAPTLSAADLTGSASFTEQIGIPPDQYQVMYKVGLPAGTAASFSRTSPVSFTIGHLSMSNTLGGDPTYYRGKSSARISGTLSDGVTPVNLSLSWNSKELTATASGSNYGTSSIIASDLLSQYNNAATTNTPNVLSTNAVVGGSLSIAGVPAAFEFPCTGTVQSSGIVKVTGQATRSKVTYFTGGSDPYFMKVEGTGGVTTLVGGTRDTNGLPLKVTSMTRISKGKTTTTYLNAAGQPQSVSLPDGSRCSFAYDSNSAISRVVIASTNKSSVTIPIPPGPPPFDPSSLLISTNVSSSATKTYTASLSAKTFAAKPMLAASQTIPVSVPVTQNVNVSVVNPHGKPLRRSQVNFSIGYKSDDPITGWFQIKTPFSPSIPATHDDASTVYTAKIRNTYTANYTPTNTFDQTYQGVKNINDAIGTICDTITYGAWASGAVLGSGVDVAFPEVGAAALAIIGLKVATEPICAKYDIYDKLIKTYNTYNFFANNNVNIDSITPYLLVGDRYCLPLTIAYSGPYRGQEWGRDIPPNWGQFPMLPIPYPILYKNNGWGISDINLGTWYCSGIYSFDLQIDNPTIWFGSSVPIKVIPDDPDAKLDLYWSSDDSDLATVDQKGNVTPTGKLSGTVTITASEKTSGYQNQIQIYVSGSIGSVLINPERVFFYNSRQFDNEYVSAYTFYDGTEISHTNWYSGTLADTPPGRFPFSPQYYDNSFQYQIDVFDINGNYVSKDQYTTQISFEPWVSVNTNGQPNDTTYLAKDIKLNDNQITINQTALYGGDLYRYTNQPDPLYIDFKIKRRNSGELTGVMKMYFH